MVLPLRLVCALLGLPCAYAAHLACPLNIPDTTCCTHSCLFSDTSENDILEATDLECGELVYDQSYSTVTKLSDLMVAGSVQNASSDLYVLVGAKESSSSSNFKVAAVGKYSDVFKPATHVANQQYTAHAAHPQLHYAAYWYYAEKKSFGFAPAADLDLGLADLGTTDCDKRLSWQIDNGLDGWRAGCKVGSDVNSWRKIVKLCVSTRYGEKRGVALMEYKPEFMAVYRASVWPVQGQAVTPVKIGTAVTLDSMSKYHKMGLILRRSYSLFAEWVNTVRGGISVQGVKCPVELILMGDHSKANSTKKVTQHMLDVENVSLFLGPYGSGLSRAAAEVIQPGGGTMVATVATATSVFANRPNVFGVYMNGASTFSNTMAEFARIGVKTIAYVMDEDFPSACNDMNGMAQSNGMTVTWSRVFTSTGSIAGDIDPIVNLLTTTNTSLKADALFGCVYEAHCQELIDALIARRIDVNAIVMTVCVGSTSWLTRKGDPDDYRFIGGTTPWMPSMGFKSQVSNWSSNDFDAAYQQSFGSAPSYHAALGWAAGIALMVAIETANSTDPNLVRDALQNMDISETVFGAIKFDSIGINTNPWKTVQYLPRSNLAAQVIPQKSGGQEYVYPIPPWSLRDCFKYNAGDAKAPCQKGLRNGQCAICPDSESARWSATGIGNNMGCVCVARQCDPGMVLNTSYVGVQCYECGAGRYSAISGECLPCLAGSYADAPKTAVCKQCAAGTVNKLTGQTACVACPPGSVSYTEGEQFCTLCRRGTNSSKSGGSSCALCSPGTVAENEGAQTCKDCPAGTKSIWGGYSCANCATGKFQAQAKMSYCRDCPLGTLCDGEGTSSPDNAENWWRYKNHPDPEQWFPCPEEGICLSQERCAPGQTDFLCGVCLPGYARSFESAKCNECPSHGMLIVIAVVGTIVMAVGTIFVSSVAVRAALKSRAITDALLKLLFNYFTTISITTGVLQVIYIKKIEEDALTTGEMPKNASTNWVFWLLSFSVTELVVPVLQLECFFDSGIHTPQEQAYVNTLTDASFRMYMDSEVVEARKWLEDFHWNTSFRVMIFWFLGPPVFLLVVITVVGIILKISLALHHSYWKEVNALADAINTVGYHEARRGKDKDHCLKLLESVESKLFGIFSYYKFAELSGCRFLYSFLVDSQPIIVVSLFLIYPTQVQMLLDPLWCVEPSNGVVGHVHSKHYNLKCYDTSDFLFWMAVGSLVILVIGVPTFAGHKIMFSGRTKQASGHDAEIGNIQSLRFLRTWSFLMAGYENGKEYWECIILVRKSLTVILSAVSIHDGARVLALLILSGGFSLLHIGYRPFDNRFDELLDRVECRHLLVWCLFCLAILWIYLSSNLSANKLARELSGSKYVPEQTTVFVAAITMCFLHFLFVASLLYAIFAHAAMAHAEYLVNLAEKRHHLRQHHPDGTESQGAGVESQATSVVTAVSGASQGAVTNMTMKDRISYFLRTGADDNLREEYLARIEKKWFGNCAHWYYDVSMDTKAHILCDSRNMWFTLTGARSHRCKPQHEVDKKLSEKKLPALALPANEDQRRYLLKILMEAMHYVIVTLEIPIIPASLLEFVFRCGFTFQSMGELRMASKRATTHERTNQMAQMVAARKLADSGDSQFETTNSLLRANAAEQGLGSSDVEIGSGMGTPTKVSSPVGGIPPTPQSTGSIAKVASPVGGIPPTPQSLKSGKSQMSVKTGGRSSDKSEEAASKVSTFHQVITINSNAREQRMKAEYMVLSEEDLRTLVKEMFAPDVFEEALSLEDFQLNLTMLRKTNKANMLKWLSIFDEECVYHRALRVQGMLENRKLFRLEMQRLKSERHNQRKKEKEEQEAKIKNLPSGATLATDASSLKNMKRFSRDSSPGGGDADSSSSSSNSDDANDSDAEFCYEQEAQTDFGNKCNLAELTDANHGVEEKLGNISNALTGQMQRYDSDPTNGDERPVYQKWVLMCANVIHMADERAAKIPATEAYARCKKREEETNNDINEIMKKMEETRKALAVAREAKRPDPRTFMRQEKDDLECTRVAIREAQEEVEALKKELAELQNQNKGGANDSTATGTKASDRSDRVKLPSSQNARNDEPSSNGNMRICCAGAR